MRWSLLVLVCGCLPPDAPASSAARCARDAAPTTLEGAAAWLSDLPPPVDAACIVASLARPLHIEGSTGTVSAQPADGPDRPRLFFASGPLRLSLVGSGPGASLLEMGELVKPGFSRKGELSLPVRGPVSAQNALDHTSDPVYGTRCAICHVPFGEDPRGGQHSEALRPSDEEVLRVDDLEELASRCAPGTPSCALLQEVFSGPVVDGPAPATWATIYE